MSRLLQSALAALPLLPNWVNAFLVGANSDPARIYGPRYAAYRKMLRSRASDDNPQSALTASVNAALGSVPYYRDRYGSRPVSSFEEFRERIGFIDREIVMAAKDRFLAEGVDLSSYDTVTTGGTSGKPLRFMAPRNRYVVEMATMHTLWERAGYRFDLRGVIRNHRLHDKEIYRINPITREVIFDGFRLCDEYFAQIYGIINRLGIRFIHCYPSTAYEFATFLKRKHLDASRITAFLSGSENIFDYQLDLIQTQLRIRFYNWYGHSEKLVLAGYCMGTDIYHVEPTYGYFELVDERGIAVKEPGGSGEIVGSALHNPGMPLIRYRTGDYAELVGHHCPACGRAVPLLRNIRGRWSGDRIYHADGTFVTTTALNLHNELYSVVNGFQYLQERKGELTVLIVKGPEFSERHHAALMDHFSRKLKPDARVEIKYVERLLRNPNGKFMHLMSKIDPQASSARR
jgi:phenylacetate-CoA ligase